MSGADYIEQDGPNPGATHATNSNNNNNNNKRANRCRSFYFRYLELCRAKNVPALPEIKTKQDSKTVLDISGDKIGVNDWLLIVEALHYDQSLRKMIIKTRKVGGVVLDDMDTERKAKLYRQKPAIYTKFVFSGIIESISNSISFNKNLRVLHLEGLPLTGTYIDTIAKAIASNEHLRDVSFNRSNLQDAGCEAICNTLKYLENIEIINMSDCQLTFSGAEHIAEMIKMQKIARFTEGWQKSLRYRDVDPNSIAGLREIYISKNPGIGDNGVRLICEALKEDVWIKVIGMEECGVSDLGANCIIDCLSYNTFIEDFNINNNEEISKFLIRSIFEQLGKEDQERKLIENHQKYLNGVIAPASSNKKITGSQLRDRLKFLEDQLEFERVLRKKAEQLNHLLNDQIIIYESHIEDAINSRIPPGFVVVRNDALQKIISERNELQEILHNNHIEMAENRHFNSAESEDSLLPELRTLPVVKLYETSREVSEDASEKTTRLRIIKSELVQMEMPAEKRRNKYEVRSDNEFITDGKAQEENPPNYDNFIGDSIQNNPRKTSRSREGPETLDSPVDKARHNFYHDCELPEVSKIDDNNSDENAYSGEEQDPDTSRTFGVHNMKPPQPVKVFMKPKSAKTKNKAATKTIEIGQGDAGDFNVDGGDDKSPRSLFFGQL